MALLYFVAASFGLVIGSFLNVCIYRIPLDRSIVSPPSACPGCGSPIRPWQNIPVISYIFLGGRCASCGIRISPRYPAIELLNSLLYVAALYHFGPDVKALVVMALLSTFIVITFIDLDHQIIPDGISIPGIFAGLVLGPLVLGTGLVNSVLGALAGGGLFYVIALLSKGGMGGGDIKLITMLGAFLGLQQVLLTIFVGSVLGALVGGGLMLLNRAHRKTPIPFGPFLVAGATVALFYGEEILGWYGGVNPWL
ncbi:MAG: prepilin peptidase [Nitrospirae bacterium]|nr:prepilin peptidase [Nitrospirota bacterium]MBI5695534.1 prepilin peptidase [Nitrospirota bacterium]